MKRTILALFLILVFGSAMGDEDRPSKCKQVFTQKYFPKKLEPYNKAIPIGVIGLGLGIAGVGHYLEDHHLTLTGVPTMGLGAMLESMRLEDKLSDYEIKYRRVNIWKLMSLAALLGSGANNLASGASYLDYYVWLVVSLGWGINNYRLKFKLNKYEE